MSKIFLNYDQQIEQLNNEKNLLIAVETYAKEVLRQTSYYSLIGGYKNIFKNPTTKKYKDGTRFEDIVEFHVCFERIHPFGDGNGRTGRMIMFKQCLQNSHIPFVLLDRDRAFYLRGLKEWDFERNYLMDTLLTQQDIYASVCEQLDFKKE